MLPTCEDQRQSGKNGAPRGEALATAGPARGPGWTLAAAVAGVLLAVGAIAGPVLGGGLGAPPSSPTYERVTVGAIGGSLEVPRGLHAQPPIEGTDGRVDLDDLRILFDTFRAARF